MFLYELFKITCNLLASQLSFKGGKDLQVSLATPTEEQYRVFLLSLKHTMKHIYYVVVIVLLYSVTAIAQVPRTISYQGILTDISGNPVPDGNKNISVNLYANITGGSPIFSESQSVTVIKGRYTLIIGGVNPIPPNLSFNNGYFLSVSIDGGSELAPRTALTSAPYAIHAAIADGVSQNAAGIVTSLNNLSGVLNLQGGGGTTITSNGHTLTISSSGSGGNGIQGLQSSDGTLTVLSSSGPIADVRLTPSAVTTKYIADASVTVAKISADGGDIGQVLTSNGFGVAVWKNPGGIILPYSSTTNLSSAAFTLSNTGTGTAIVGVQNNNGTINGYGVQGIHSGGGAGVFGQSTNGAGVSGLSSAGNSGLFSNITAGNTAATLSVVTNGSGAAISSTASGSGRAGLFTINQSTNSSAALESTTNGTGGTTLKLNHTGTGGNIAIFQSANTNVARIDKTGKGFFNGGTQTSGADVAEAFAVVGKRSDYEPGDVLVIASGYRRTVEKCSKPYAVNVIGVHATKPGVLLSERDVEANADDLVPMGVVGVLPTKVCNEGGIINAGDLLVTSSRLGYAMKADPEKLKFGMVIGKALEVFSGDIGLIEVFVNVK